MEVVRQFISSNEIEKDLGITSYQDRKLLYQICHDNNIHTLSLPTGHVNDKNEPIKNFMISKIPFTIVDKELFRNITNEIKFLFDIRQEITLEEIITLKERHKAIVERFLYQFSFYYSNDYSRLIYHRKDITNKIKDELSKMTIPEHRYHIKQTKGKFFKIENCNKSYVRFDMINAISAVIGIADWKQYMSNFTRIDLYQTSKPLRGLIMKDIHPKCMLLIADYIHEFVISIPNHLKQEFLYINNDEVIIVFNDDVEKLLVPKHFRTEIFHLSYEENDKHCWFVETHSNDIKRIKAKRQK